MKQGSTIFLKIAVFLIGTPVFVACIFGLPMIAMRAAESNLDYAFALYGILAVMYVAAIPFFVALYQAFKLLIYIDKGEAFSELSVTSLKKIKNCAIIIGGLYVIGMPFIYIFADRDDAPGVILIGMFFILASMIIAVFAAVLQRLLQEAIHIKSENDLIV